MKNRYILFFLCVLAIYQVSCRKYLDAKPDGKLSTLASLEDITAFLDNYQILNQNVYPADLDVGADFYYLTEANYNSITLELDKKQYAWQKDELVGGISAWQLCYRVIYNVNIALSSLKDFSPSTSQKSKYDELTGSALFYRGFYMHALSQLFTLPYNKHTSETTLGLPIRLDPEFETISSRSNLAATYERILSDLKDAASALPDESSIKTRPSKLVAFSALARVYLTMREYDSAAVYANKSLHINKDLMEYSELNATANAPFVRFNKEVSFFATSNNSKSILSVANAKIDPVLYQSYEENDLRKVAFFRANTGANAGTFAWKGGYDGAGTYTFGGPATDEMYLTRAECYARSGNTALAMKDLNDLLRTRWKKINGITTYVDKTASNSQHALSKILEERKKELLYRGLRWMDMRRLSLDPEFAVTYKRIIGSQVYELPPGSNRYAMSIPLSVIAQTKMEQNP